MFKEKVTAKEAKTKMLLSGLSAVEGDFMRFDWAGAGFTLRFRGRSIRLYPSLTSPDVPVYIQAVFDGAESRHAISESSEVLVFDNGCEGEHTLTLVRLTEIRTAPKNTDSLLLTHLEIRGDAPAFLPPPQEKKRRIAFFGDSITNGWGVLGDKTETVFRIDEEDVTRAYAYRLATEFDAAYEICAVSGHGVVASCHGDRDEPMKIFLDLAARAVAAKRDFSAGADAVCIALGTNDCGTVPEEEFAVGCRAYLSLIRARFPKAEIFWIYGMMNQRYVPLLTELVPAFDAKCHFIPSAPLRAEMDEIGCCGHPNEKGAFRIKEEVAAEIRRVLGW